MQQKLKLMPLLMVLLAISYPVWGQAGKNMVTYTIDGGVFHHRQVTINADPKELMNGAWTRSGVNYIKINLNDAPPNATEDPIWCFNMAFNHLGMGMAKVNDPIINATPGDDKRVNVRLQVLANGKTIFVTTLTPPGITPAPGKTSGTITITRFGSVHQAIEGSFEGKFIDAANVTYTIAGGHFIATRKA